MHLERFTDQAGELFIKIPLISNLKNQRGWRATEEANERYAATAIGKPLTLMFNKEESLFRDFHPFSPDAPIEDREAHVNFAEKYAYGRIVDVTKDSGSYKSGSGEIPWFAIARITDPTMAEEWRKPNTRLIPPAFSPGIAQLQGPDDAITQYEILHVASVPSGAFGPKFVALGKCEGDIETCTPKLRAAARSSVFKEKMTEAEEKAYHKHDFPEPKVDIKDTFKTTPLPSKREVAEKFKENKDRGIAVTSGKLYDEKLKPIADKDFAKVYEKYPEGKDTPEHTMALEDKQQLSTIRQQSVQRADIMDHHVKETLGTAAYTGDLKDMPGGDPTTGDGGKEGDGEGKDEGSAGGGEGGGGEGECCVHNQYGGGGCGPCHKGGSELQAATSLENIHAEILDTLEGTGLTAREEEPLERPVLWHTTVDDRTCGVCERLDGGVFNRDEAQRHFPAHTHCRCELRTELGEADILGASYISPKIKRRKKKLQAASALSYKERCGICPKDAFSSLLLKSGSSDDSMSFNSNAQSTPGPMSFGQATVSDPSGQTLATQNVAPTKTKPTIYIKKLRFTGQSTEPKPNGEEPAEGGEGGDTGNSIVNPNANTMTDPNADRAFRSSIYYQKMKNMEKQLNEQKAQWDYKEKRYQLEKIIKPSLFVDGNNKFQQKAWENEIETAIKENVSIEWLKKYYTNMEMLKQVPEIKTKRASAPEWNNPLGSLQSASSLEADEERIKAEKALRLNGGY